MNLNFSVISPNPSLIERGYLNNPPFLKGDDGGLLKFLSYINKIISFML